MVCLHRKNILKKNNNNNKHKQKQKTATEKSSGYRWISHWNLHLSWISWLSKGNIPFISNDSIYESGSLTFTQKKSIKISSKLSSTQFGSRKTQFYCDFSTKILTSPGSPRHQGSFRHRRLRGFRGTPQQQQPLEISQRTHHYVNERVRVM